MVARIELGCSAQATEEWLLSYLLIQVFCSLALLALLQVRASHWHRLHGLCLRAGCEAVASGEYKGRGTSDKQR